MTNTTKRAGRPGADLCTIAWAAERLGISQRQVLRYLGGRWLGEPGRRLDAVLPLIGSRESLRHKRLLRVGDVRALDVARTGHLRDDNRLCFPSCPHESHGSA